MVAVDGVNMRPVVVMVALMLRFWQFTSETLLLPPLLDEADPVTADDDTFVVEVASVVDVALVVEVPFVVDVAFVAVVDVAVVLVLEEEVAVVVEAWVVLVVPTPPAPPVALESPQATERAATESAIPKRKFFIGVASDGRGAAASIASSTL